MRCVGMLLALMTCGCSLVDHAFDWHVNPDLAASPDLKPNEDLSTTGDLSTPADLSMGPDLAGVKRIFVTQATFAGNFRDSASEDANCDADPARPVGGTFKALLVDGTNRRACSTIGCTGGASEQIDWVFRPSSLYVSVATGQVISTNATGLLDFPLPGALDSQSGVFFWSGLSNNSWTTIDTCTLWHDTGVFGGVGTTNALDVNLIFTTVHGCATTAHLLCVEQ